jgi:hypothetical protein
MLVVQFSVIHRRLPEAASPHANRVRSYGTACGYTGSRGRRADNGD